MSIFQKHLDKIFAEISANQISTILKADFGIIRNYLLDILRTDALLKSIISDTPLLDKPFKACFVLDLSTSVREIKIDQRFGILELLASKMEDRQFQFMRNSFLSHPAKILKYMQDVIQAGLGRVGCFVRGQKGEVYELELDPLKHLRNEFITIDVIFDNRQVTIDFMVLIDCTQSSMIIRPQPRPLSKNKTPWLVAVAYERFSVYVPNLDTSVAQCGQFVVAYRLLRHLLAKRELFNVKDFFVVSALYEVYWAKTTNKNLDEDTPSVVDVTISILRRMVYYFDQDLFPFYWNTSVNLLKYFQSKSTKLFVQNQLVKLLVFIKTMDRASSLDSDEVLKQLEIQVNSETFKVDQFGIFKML